MQKDRFVLDKMGIVFQIFLMIILILVEVFDLLTNYLYKIFPFKRNLRIAKIWLKKTPIYKTYKKLVNKALILSDNNFLWLILFMSILSIPFIYIFPFLTQNVFIKVGSIVIGKLISSSTTTLIAVGSDKLLRINFINKTWSIVKEKYTLTKQWFSSLSFAIRYKKFKDENSSIFMQKLKYFSSKAKDKTWRKKYLTGFLDRVWYRVEK